MPSLFSFFTNLFRRRRPTRPTRQQRQQPTPPRTSGGEELTQFLTGYTIFPETTHIFSARYLPESQTLQLTDQNAHTHNIGSIDLAKAEQFFSSRADTKDKWLEGRYEVDYGRPQGPEDERDYDDKGTANAFVSGQMALHFMSSFGPIAVKYRPEIRALGIEMKDGFIASFTDVPPDFVAALAKAPSKGKFWHAQMKMGYQADGKHWIHRYPYHPGINVNSL